MSKLTAEVQKIFAQDAPTAEVAQIGSFKAGAALKTKDIATIQALSEYLDGLSDITGAGANLPLLEDINAMYFLATRQLTYLYQSGIPEWNTSQEYYADVSFVQVAGVIYRSKTGTGGSPNQGNTPVGDTTNWAPMPDLIGVTDWLWTAAALVGDSLSISGTDSPVVATLTSTLVAFLDAANEKLRAYSFDGTTWSLEGSEFSIPSISAISMTALNATDVAVFDGETDTLRAYTFNGSIWAALGNAFSLAGAAASTAITALSGTDVALIDEGLDSLRTYTFDGSDWSLVGSGFALTTASPALAALSSTDVAFVDVTSGELRTYTFNGSVWALVGSGLTISAAPSNPIIAALNATDVAYYDVNNDELRAYRWNGSVWVPSPVVFSLSATVGVGMTALNETDIAFVSGSLDVLRAYRYYAAYAMSPMPTRI